MGTGPSGARISAPTHGATRLIHFHETNVRAARMSTGGFIKSSLIVVLALGLFVGLGSFAIRDRSGARITVNQQLVAEATRGEFISSVIESGDVDSSKNVEIRCKVKSQGRAGTQILDIIPEGSIVAKDDFLAQLDDSLLVDELTEQKILEAEDKAAVIQAQSDLDTALRVLEEYQNGTYEQERATLEAEKALAEEMLRRAGDYRNYSENLNRKGYITKTQLDADKFAVVKAEKDLNLATQKLSMFERYTRERMVAEYSAEIEKQRANLDAAKFKLELSQLRLKELQQQVAACRITAPIDGMVVYANELDRGGDVALVIEEGVLVRDGQPIIRMPDNDFMEVKVNVSESKISLVQPGQTAIVRLDTDREVVVAGKVRQVSTFPLPRRWFQAPVEYEVFVDITEKHAAVRPGLRAKVEMIVEQLPDAIQSPVSALVREGEEFFVLVSKADGIEIRRVTVGPANIRNIVITAGLEPGEKVILDPETYWPQLKAKVAP
jgi:RND family efflux transporter MFP subunit